MKNKPCISIIVPVYNVEKYLKKCIASILKQTFKDFELILVDDGSTDHSGKMCDDFAKIDSRICVVHKENGGLSSARNKGISIARGDYLGFVDSDDYIAPDMYEILYENLIKENADLSVCGSYDCYVGQKCKINKPYYKVVDTQDAIKLIFTGKAGGASAGNKLYRRKIFNDVSYPEGRMYEDAFVIVQILMKCKRIVITSKQKYYYYHREDSITTQKFSKKQFDIIEAYENNLCLIETYFPQIRDVAMGSLYWANFIVLDRMICTGCEIEYKKEAKKIIYFLRMHYKDILQCDTLKKSRRISMLVLKFSFLAYKILSKYNSSKFLKLNA